MLGILLFTAVAMAGDPPAEEATEERKVVYKQRTEIDFEGLEIEGQLIKPTGALLLERKTAAFNPLIELRRDFNIEISESTKEIR